MRTSCRDWRLLVVVFVEFGANLLAQRRFLVFEEHMQSRTHV